MRPTSSVLFGALLLSLLCVSPSPADIDGDRFVSKRWGISVRAPRNWQLSEQTSYPSILLWMARRSPDGKMLLSVEHVTGKLDTLGYVKQTSSLLREMGFRVRAPQFHAPTGAYWIDFDDGSSYLRQAYQVRDETATVLTLSAPSGRIRNQHLRAFDFALSSLKRAQTKVAPVPTQEDAGPKK